MGKSEEQVLCPSKYGKAIQVVCLTNVMAPALQGSGGKSREEQTNRNGTRAP